MTNWSSFTKKLGVNAPIEKLYWAWSTQEGIESWFLRKAIYTKLNGATRKPEEPIQAGDEYLWHWHGFPDSVNEANKIVSANGKDQLQFYFTGNCLVTVSLESFKGQTIVSITQENIPEDQNPKTNLLVGCGEGWTFYLANLKSILEGGVDLRNKDEELTGVINS